MSSNDLARVVLVITASIYLIYNVGRSWIRLGERQLGITDGYENAAALLFPSVTMCPMVMVNKGSLEAALLNSNSASRWFNNISNHSNQLLQLKHTYKKGERYATRRHLCTYSYYCSLPSITLMLK